MHYFKYKVLYGVGDKPRQKRMAEGILPDNSYYEAVECVSECYGDDNIIMLLVEATDQEYLYEVTNVEVIEHEDTIEGLVN